MDRNRLEVCVYEGKRNKQVDELSTYMMMSALFDGGWSMAVDDVVCGEGAVVIIIIF